MQINTPLFTPQELEENQFNKAKLALLLQSGDGILMAGAGTTACIYPDWNNFVEILSEEAQKISQGFPEYDPQKNDFLTYVDEVKNCIGEELYYNIIFRCFNLKPDSHRKFHESLCNLLIKGNLRAITTTNYDPVFENALVAVTGKLAEAIWIDANIEEARIFEFFLSINSGAVPKRIFHIHGVYHQKGSIVLSKKEYESKYGFKLVKPNTSLLDSFKIAEMEQKDISELLTAYGLSWTIHRKIIWSLFATRRLIFLGFSLTDPFFEKMLEFVSNDLHTYGYDWHFLILRIRNEEEKVSAKLRSKKLKEEFGIQTIFFEENEVDTGLENFVFDMEKLAVPNKIVTELDTLDKKNIVLEDDEQLTKELIEISKQK